MGFFLSDKQYKKSLPKSTTVPIEILHQKRCSACTLNNEHLIHPKMEPTGSDSPFIYMLGEAPGSTEDKEGIQFIGKSGSLLREVLDKVCDNDFVWDYIPPKEFIESYVRWNNVIRCHPPENRKPTEVEVECCRKFIEEDIAKTKPAVIIGFGLIPLKWFFKEYNNVGSWRGRKIPVTVGGHSCWFLPVFHPSFISRNQSKYGENEWDKVFRHDLLRAVKFSISPTFESPKIQTSGFTDGVTYVLGKSQKDLDRVEEELKWFGQQPVVGLDIENSPLKPYTNDSYLVSVALSTGDRTFSFPLEHPKAWTQEQLEYLHGIFKYFLMNSGTKVCHNLVHELEWFKSRYGPEVIFKPDWACTMSQGYVLDERAGRKGEGMLNLGVLTLLNLGFNVKKLSNVDVKNILDNPLEEVLKYNGLDAKYTFELYVKQDSKLLNKLKAVELHHIETSKSIAMMHSIGFCVDDSKIKELSGLFGGILEDIQKEIKELRPVRKYEKRTGKEFNPLSNRQLPEIFMEMGLEKIKETKSRGFSTDDEVLNQYAKKGVKLASLVQDLRSITKMKSTYVDSIPGLLSDDGMLRTSFNHCLTATGRLSSDGPNMQNFPKREFAVTREIIVPRSHHWFVASDYAQLEGRIIALTSQDKVFCKAIREGYDVHMEWARRITKEYPKWLGVSDISKVKDWKNPRYRAKNEWVFPLFYLAHVKSVSASLGLPLTVGQELYDEFWSMFSGVKKWQEGLLEFYDKNGYVEAMTGRRRRGVLNQNKIVNFPIQGMASDVVVKAMNRLSRMSFEQSIPQIQPLLNIHDDLSFYLPNKTLDMDIEYIAQEMVRPIFESKEEVPFAVEVSVGTDWHALEEVGVFSSQQFKYA